MGLTVDDLKDFLLNYATVDIDAFESLTEEEKAFLEGAQYVAAEILKFTIAMKDEPRND